MIYLHFIELENPSRKLKNNFTNHNQDTTKKDRRKSEMKTNMKSQNNISLELSYPIIKPTNEIKEKLLFTPNSNTNLNKKGTNRRTSRFSIEKLLKSIIPKKKIQNNIKISQNIINEQKHRSLRQNEQKYKSLKYNQQKIAEKKQKLFDNKSIKSIIDFEPQWGPTLPVSYEFQTRAPTVIIA